MAAATSAPDAPRTIQRFGSVVIVGGGCYGSWYLRQLGRAARAGAARWRALLVVDRDPACAAAAALAAQAEWGGQPAPRLVVEEWTPFFSRWLATAALQPDAHGADAIVPSPLMPHLLFDWVLERARLRWPGRDVVLAPLERAPQTPWERAAPDGTHYLSFATWMCPINCIEPARCPHTRGPRDWSMPDAVRAYAGAGRGTPAAVFHCVHRTYGVGMIDVRDILAADAEAARLGEQGPFEMLVGTMSHCHGALGRLVVR